MVAAALLVAMASWANVAATSCPNQISSCGCVITAAGDYQVTVPLTHSPNGRFCLEVDAAGARLNLGGNSITDSPPPPQPPPVALDTGIDLTERATKAIVVGAGATISGFSVGVEIAGAGSIVSDLKADQNLEGIDLNTRGVQLTRIDASNNGDNGLNLFGASENQISNLTANGNVAEGIWISNISDANYLSSFQANSNGDDGVRVSRFVCGRLTDGPQCRARAGRRNYVVGGDASGNQRVGIFVDQSPMTTVLGNTASTNKQADLMDGASDCDHNLWFGNTFGTASPPGCIH